MPSQTFSTDLEKCFAARTAINDFNTMSTATIDPTGSVMLSADLRHRYHLDACTSVRVVETRHGLLLVPLTNDPIPPELQRELDEWQSLDAAAWDAFPYEEPT